MRNIAIGIILAFAVRSANAAGWTTGYSYRKAITINHAQVAGASSLTNFPVLIAVTDANLQSAAKTDGSDILFTASDGITKLNHEIEGYNSVTGQLTAWVNVPSVSPSSDTLIYLYYGNAAASSQQNAAGVWSNGYRGVWHLKDGSTLSVADSSGLGTVTTNNGSVPANAKIGGGASFNGTSQYIAIGSNANLDFAPPVTVSLWFKYTTADSNARRLFMKEGRYASWLTGSTLNFGAWGASNVTWTYGAALAPGTWYMATFVADATNVTLYLNGVQKAQTAHGTLTQTAGNGLDLGRYSGSGSQYFSGVEDEFRVANVVRTAEWVATEYNNQNAPGSFVTLGAQEAPSGGTTVTVTSTPVGMGLTVDGAGCTTPCAFQWTAGIGHTIAAATQAGSTGIQYTFADWSDGGAATHTVTGPDTATTYTAHFTTQYFLTTGAIPSSGGTVNPASGWHDSGSVVPVSAAPADHYQFSGFTGALTGTVTPQSVTLSGPVTVTANFSTVRYSRFLPIVW